MKAISKPRIVRILLKFRRYFKNFVGFSKILGVSSGILEDSWRILRAFSVGYSNSHMALPEAFFVEQTLQYCWTLSPLCFQSL